MTAVKTNMIRICPICNSIVTRAKAIYCTDRCTAVANRINKKDSKRRPDDTRPSHALKCDSCKLSFSSLNPSTKFCIKCKVTTNIAKELKTPAKASALACSKCKHWVACEGADYGFQCQIGFWRVCKPYLPNSKPKEALV